MHCTLNKGQIYIDTVKTGKCGNFNINQFLIFSDYHLPVYYCEVITRKTVFRSEGTTFGFHCAGISKGKFLGLASSKNSNPNNVF